MELLLISPVDVPITAQSRYVGIERLVWEYSKGLSALGHKVTVIGHPQSEFLPEVTLLSNGTSELSAYLRCQGKVLTCQAGIDFSHQHLACRLNPKLPIANIFWHAPALARYPKAPYNIIAPSQWAKREFERVYGYKARAQNVIAIDSQVYTNGSERSDRFLTMGRMAEEKGNLNAVLLCKEIGLKLDVAGGRGIGTSPDAPLTDYEKAVRGLCDGKQIRFLGEVSESEKLTLLKTAKGLIYCTDHPEVTGHKYQEALMCGCPVIMSSIGSAPEWIEHGVTGYLCKGKLEFQKALQSVQFDSSIISRKAHEVYSIPVVMKQWETILTEMAGGVCW